MTPHERKQMLDAIADAKKEIAGQAINDLEDIKGCLKHKGKTHVYSYDFIERLVLEKLNHYKLIQKGKL